MSTYNKELINIQIKNLKNSETFARLVNSKKIVLFEEVRNLKDFQVF